MTARTVKGLPRFIRGLLLVVFCSIPVFPANALSTDTQQPIEIEADSLEVREKERISIYSGNVRLIQGSIEINCAQLTLYFNENKELLRMLMTGAPATFRQLDDLQQELRGQGEQMEYRQAESTLVLSGNASFTHAGDSIESNKIIIDTITGSIEAGSKDSEGRVRMLIQPREQ